MILQVLHEFLCSVMKSGHFHMPIPHSPVSLKSPCEIQTRVHRQRHRRQDVMHNVSCGNVGVWSTAFSRCRWDFCLCMMTMLMMMFSCWQLTFWYICSIDEVRNKRQREKSWKLQLLSLVHMERNVNWTSTFPHKLSFIECLFSHGHNWTQQSQTVAVNARVDFYQTCF